MAYNNSPMHNDTTARTAELSWSQWTFSPEMALPDTPECDEESQREINFTITRAVHDLCFGRIQRKVLDYDDDADDVFTKEDEDLDDEPISLMNISVIEMPEVTVRSRSRSRRCLLLPASPDYNQPLSSTRKSSDNYTASSSSMMTSCVSRNLLCDLLEDEILFGGSRGDSDVPRCIEVSPIHPGSAVHCDSTHSHSGLTTALEESCGSFFNHTTDSQNTSTTIDVDSDASSFFQRPLYRHQPVTRRTDDKKSRKVHTSASGVERTHDRRRAIAKSLKTFGRMLRGGKSTSQASKSSSSRPKVLAVL